MCISSKNFIVNKTIRFGETLVSWNLYRSSLCGQYMVNNLVNMMSTNNKFISYVP